MSTDGLPACMASLTALSSTDTCWSRSPVPSPGSVSTSACRPSAWIRSARGCREARSPPKPGTRITVPGWSVRTAVAGPGSSEPTIFTASTTMAPARKRNSNRRLGLKARHLTLHHPVSAEGLATARAAHRASGYGRFRLLGDQVQVDRRSSPNPGRGHADQLLHRVGHVAGDPHAGNLRGLAVGRDVGAGRVLDGVETERGEHVGVGASLRGDDKGLVVQIVQTADLALDDTDAARLELPPPRVVELDDIVEVEGDVGAPLPPHQGLVRGHLATAEHADALVPHLPAVAVRTVQDVRAPPLGHT